MNSSPPDQSIDGACNGCLQPAHNDALWRQGETPRGGTMSGPVLLIGFDAMDAMRVGMLLAQ